MNENIEEIEKLLVKPKEWKYAGEVDIRKRPKNSLLTEEDIDFRQGPPLLPFSSKQDSEIESITLQRIREGTFDNHEYNTKKVAEVTDEILDVDNLEFKDVLSLYNEIEGDLMQIVDFGNNGFTPDCEIKIVQEEKASLPKKRLEVKSLDRIRNVTVLKKN
ncbi:U3 small nucleolar ribonucleoprotein component Mpp10 [Encephalitozoon intestinalis ATCC 50506]|uniref:U3 small nucleolar ribonucleoprotein component Mpp10 n=1 Tax=Encephalitozoon intestinalis (strain ATCC 50506) TaxID=876142 RepID=E0S598_ENCIT|nr:U3 small nucleolar ribonucleoprotein component Mpp10 [Encephalitozoon intestinalis ATCC 50506]ADM10883.1 U3 small nucleolar ribonucleoprotein component Mpp10 [Encephalitozoon intestinalis ATCC 50506]UTX44515.1 U3 small nucleolar ribonucleoprotein component Mpp10 [Encephalitozoon intestinalis]